MSDSTVLTPEPATPKAGEGAAPAASGAPKATPEGSANAQGEKTPSPAKPDGSSQEPTKGPDGQAKPAEGQEPKPAAPEVWTYKDLKTPEGIEIDPAFGEQFTKIAQDLKLSKDTAQKLADLQSEIAVKSVSDAVAQWDSMKESWKTETVKELGTDADKQLAFAKTFMDKFGDEELRQLLNDTGAGNHKALVRCLIKAGKAMSEDTFTEGKTRTGNEGKTPAEILYGKK